MSVLDVLHPDGSDFDAFLFAEVGEDRNGAPVTVLSALARLDLEPWTEAGALSHLSRKDAQARLTRHFEAITDIPALAQASESKAAKLVSLLPKRVARHGLKSSETGTGTAPKLALSWTTITFVAVVGLALILYLGQTG
ncbi:hypothetical protein [Cognatishimia sp. F0-27]|uniref:hypothetical protein n=1 Tax=Cognatishimia sp. F0-27 TaxID=2816855 RepID=UPI001D0C6D5A|nr:hypothetical protein [Cognatishimia sp. F0-27]MCC1491473.1 hypothetical protein [Cognatishimia sp. F0-27]